MNKLAMAKLRKFQNFQLFHSETSVYCIHTIGISKRNNKKKVPVFARSIATARRVEFWRDKRIKPKSHSSCTLLIIFVVLFYLIFRFVTSSHLSITELFVQNKDVGWNTQLAKSTSQNHLAFKKTGVQS